MRPHRLDIARCCRSRSRRSSASTRGIVWLAKPRICGTRLERMPPDATRRQTVGAPRIRANRAGSAVVKALQVARRLSDADSPRRYRSDFSVRSAVRIGGAWEGKLSVAPKARAKRVGQPKPIRRPYAGGFACKQDSWGAEGSVGGDVEPASRSPLSRENAPILGDDHAARRMLRNGLSP